MYELFYTICREFSRLVNISQTLEKEIGIDSVVFVGSQMFAAAIAITPESRRRDASRAHRYEIQRQVHGLYPVYENKPQQELEIGRHTVRIVEDAVRPIEFATAVERRVCRNKSQPHLPSAEMFRRIVPHASVQVVVVDEMYIAIDGIRIGIL